MAGWRGQTLIAHGFRAGVLDEIAGRLPRSAEVQEVYTPKGVGGSHQLNLS
jgi:hypothetical protein